VELGLCRGGIAPDGTYVLDCETGCAVGLIFWLAVAGICFLVHKASV